MSDAKEKEPFPKVLSGLLHPLAARHHKMLCFDAKNSKDFVKIMFDK